MKTRIRLVKGALAGLFVIGTLSAHSALADDGMALVLEKDAAKRILTLDSDRNLKVTGATTIENEQGESVQFADIPTARKFEGRYAITGSERIEYEASDVGGDWIATRIVLKPVVGH